MQLAEAGPPEDWISEMLHLEDANGVEECGWLTAYEDPDFGGARIGC